MDDIFAAYPATPSSPPFDIDTRSLTDPMPMVMRSPHHTAKPVMAENREAAFKSHQWNEPAGLMWPDPMVQGESAPYRRYYAEMDIHFWRCWACGVEIVQTELDREVRYYGLPRTLCPEA